MRFGGFFAGNWVFSLFLFVDHERWVYYWG